MKNIAIAILLLSTLNSCIKTLELEAKDKTSKLVVNSLFLSGEIWKVHVSKSLSVLDRGNLEDVTNATVKIIEEDGNSLILPHFVNGIYRPTGITIGISENKKFKIEVSAPGFKTVTSENICPQKTLISSASYTDSKNELGFEAIDRKIKVSIKDRSGEENYYVLEYEVYQFRIDTNSTTGQIDTTVNGGGISYLESSSPFVDGSGSSFSTPFITFTDNLFDGKTQEITFSSYIYDNGIGSNHSINRVSLYTVSKETYRYYKSMNAYIKAEDNPFAEPVQVFSNIENGFGIFAGKSKSEFIF